MKAMLSLLLLTVLALPVQASDLLLVERDIRDLEGDTLLDDLDVLHISVDWMLALGTPDLAERVDVSVILEGPVDLETLRMAFVRNEEGAAAAEALGEVLLQREDVVLLRIADGTVPPAAVPGIHMIRPLRVHEPRALEPFRPAGIDSDPVIADLVAAVDQDTVLAVIQHLEDYGTRLCVAPEFDEACAWVETRFESWGLEAEIQPFSFNYYGTTYESANVIAELPGSVEPDAIVIICGHLDSISWDNPYVTAPGADDNASGCAAVLEGARLFSQMDFHHTVRFICFGAEELGLIGSDYYATLAAAAGDSIIAVVNLDMLLYAPDSLRTLWVPYNTASTYLAFDLLDAAGTYVPELDVEVEYAPGATYSDHASFWQQGYPAVLGIEVGVDQNPHYHSPTDLLANYMEYFPFGTECVRTALAVAAVYAQPVGTGIGEGAAGGIPALEVSPVPASGSMTVRLPGASTGGSIRVLDLAGRVRLSARLVPGGEEALLDVSGLPSGTYLVEAVAGSRRATRAAVVLR